MNIPLVKYPDVAAPKNDMEKIRDTKATDIDSEKARLKKATKEFEAFFSYQLLKTMRKTIPKSSLSEGGTFSSGMGKDIFTDMFDMKIAKQMVDDTDRSISGILYRSLEKLIEAPYKNSVDNIEIKSLQEIEQREFELPEVQPKGLKREDVPIQLDKRPGDFLPVSSGIRQSSGIGEDTILSKFGEEIEAAAEKYSLDPALIISVIKAESDGNPQAVSRAGAKGLMQLIDSTAQELEVKNVFDPKENIDAGSRYLREQLDRFDGSVKLALAAYNAGPGNVMRYDGIPPFKETELYVNKVIDSLRTINSGMPQIDLKGTSK